LYACFLVMAIIGQWQWYKNLSVNLKQGQTIS
jgi:hypothetical protein